MFVELFNFSGWWILPLLGFLIGYGGAMVGGGGGIIFLPILSLFFAVPAVLAVPTALAASIPICLVASLQHQRKGNTNLKIAFRFILAGAFGAVFGAYVMRFLNDEILLDAYGIYAILIAIAMVFSIQKRLSRRQTSEERQKSLPAWQLVILLSLAAIAGFLTGSLGISASAPILAALFILGLPYKQVIGTSLFIVLFNTIVALGSHTLSTDVDYKLMLLLSIGAIPGALMGAGRLNKLNLKSIEDYLPYLYALVIFILGLLMLMK